MSWLGDHCYMCDMCPLLWGMSVEFFIWRNVFCFLWIILSYPLPTKMTCFVVLILIMSGCCFNGCFRGSLIWVNKDTEIFKSLVFIEAFCACCKDSSSFFALYIQQNIIVVSDKNTRSVWDVKVNCRVPWVPVAILSFLNNLFYEKCIPVMHGTNFRLFHWVRSDEAKGKCQY